jgi:hypothetical protein
MTNFNAGNVSDLREVLLILAAHMLVGLFAKYGIASFQTLKTVYQSVRYDWISLLFSCRILFQPQETRIQSFCRQIETNIRRDMAALLHVCHHS